MNAALVQYNPVWEDKRQNMMKIDSLLERNGGKHDMIIFPEMTLTGFTMNPKTLAEEFYGRSLDYFSGIAQNYNADVFAGIIEEKEGKYFNTLVHLGRNGEPVSSYRKIHPFSYSSEDKHYEAGSDTVITRIGGYKTGLSICYDLRFPELYRFYGKERADIIINIANWPIARIEHWRTLLKARAIENQAFVIGVNRVGNDPKLSYNGCSGIFDPMGNTVVMEEDKEKIITAEFDPAYAAEVKNQLPFLRDIKMI